MTPNISTHQRHLMLKVVSLKFAYNECIMTKRRAPNSISSAFLAVGFVGQVIFVACYLDIIYNWI